MSREVNLDTTKYIPWADSKPIDSEIHSHFAPCVWPPKTSITIHIGQNQPFLWSYIGHESRLCMVRWVFLHRRILSQFRSKMQIFET